MQTVNPDRRDGPPEQRRFPMKKVTVMIEEFFHELYVSYAHSI